ncbi:MAG: thioesterase family protein [Paludibacteraceae bacterium]
MKSYTQSLVVNKNHAASVLGSGFLNVFATPAMVAFMENTAAKAIDDLDDGYTTVGVEINVRHLKASKIGEKVTCTAILVRHERRVYEFEINVTDSGNILIGTATHQRVAVNAEQFMKNLDIQTH